MRPWTSTPPMFGFWVFIEPSDIMGLKVAEEKCGISEAWARKIIGSLNKAKLNDAFWPDVSRLDLPAVKLALEDPSRFEATTAELERQVRHVMATCPRLATESTALQTIRTMAPSP